MSPEKHENSSEKPMGRPRKGGVDSKSLGGQLTAAMDEKKISPEKLAEMLDVKRTSVVRWQRNQALPTPQNIKRINEILEVELDRPPRTHGSKGKPKKPKGPTQSLTPRPEEIKLLQLLRELQGKLQINPALQFNLQLERIIADIQKPTKKLRGDIRHALRLELKRGANG